MNADEKTQWNDPARPSLITSVLLLILSACIGVHRRLIGVGFCRHASAFIGGLGCLLFSILALAQADYAREQRWAEEIRPGIVVGDAVDLEAAGRKFLAIWTPNARARTGVIVVHGLGLHPDWGLINPLRSQLAEQGYATLSVQMPVAFKEVGADRYPPLFPEAAERLRAAADFLRARGLKRIAIVAHSMGARMANHYLGTASDARVDAWVAIGLQGAFAAPATLRAPVLDIFGELDQPAVIEGAPARAAVLRNLRGSAQVQVAGADHFFGGMEAELARRIILFLDARVRP
jgi:pimeloyl-ACP methyl ester carboxylesterase